MAKDEYEDALGNLFRQYPLEDDPKRAEPVPSVDILGRSDERKPVDGARSRRQRRGARTSTRGESVETMALEGTTTALAYLSLGKMHQLTKF